MRHAVGHRVVALVADACKHWEGKLRHAGSQQIGVETAQFAHRAAAAYNNHSVPVFQFACHGIKGFDDAFLHLFALHGGGEEFGGEVKTGLFELSAKVAVTGCRGCGYHGDALREPRQFELLIEREHAVFAQLRQDFAPPPLHVAKGIIRVDVDDVQRKAVHLMEGCRGPYEHFQARLQPLSRCLLKPRAEQVVGAAPDIGPCLGDKLDAGCIFLYKFEIAVPIGGNAHFAHFRHNPIGLVERLFQNAAHQIVQFAKAQRTDFVRVVEE